MTTADFTDDELLDIGNALEAAAKATATELQLARAKPYTRALESQQKRYEALYVRVVRAVEKP